MHNLPRNAAVSDDKVWMSIGWESPPNSVRAQALSHLMVASSTTFRFTGSAPAGYVESLDVTSLQTEFEDPAGLISVRGGVMNELA